MVDNDIKKDLRFKLKVRVYGKGLDTTQSHGYCVDDTPLGISASLGELVIDVRCTNLKQMRTMIQYNRSSHMDKRSIMFQEALFIMSRMPNYFNRPKEELNKYVFGFIRKDNQQVKLISLDREDEPIAALIGAADFFLHDLIMVPFSQIPTDIDIHIDKIPINEPLAPYPSPEDVAIATAKVCGQNTPKSGSRGGKSRSRQAIEIARENAKSIN